MTKLSPAAAGYMELQNAQKDAGCEKVDVPGGVSKDRGCCNEFQPKDKTVTAFRCGNCEYLLARTFGGRIGENR